MKNKILLLICIAIFGISCKNNNTTKEAKTPETIAEVGASEKAEITPISHATAVITFKDEVLYIDPTGGAAAFEGFDAPSYIIITDVHGDHMNIKTLSALDLSEATLIAPKAVADQLTEITVKEVVVMNNDDKQTFADFSIEAIPMYNLREEALKFHTKGRGNGYVLTIADERIYFSGDTEDIPEMRNLKNIDRAFVCMNLPYTMTVESAASAVLDFKPKEVYPYHYRGTDGKSDVAKFKSLVNDADSTIEVVQLQWY